MEPIPNALLTTIADLGDTNMRMHVAASPSISVDAAHSLIILGNKRIIAELRANPCLPARVDFRARTDKAAARQAERHRTSFVPVNDGAVL
jgi:hypothetical protein